MKFLYEDKELIRSICIGSVKNGREVTDHYVIGVEGLGNKFRYIFTTKDGVKKQLIIEGFVIIGCVVDGLEYDNRTMMGQLQVNSVVTEFANMVNTVGIEVNVQQY